MRRRPELLVEAHDRGAQQRRLVGEVPVQPTAGHPGDLGHLRYRRRPDSLGAQAHFCRVDQAITDVLGGRAARHPVVSLPFLRPDKLDECILSSGRRIPHRCATLKRSRQISISVHYAGTDGSELTMAETIQQLLRERAEQDTVAVTYGDRILTWREHIAEAGAHAAAVIGMADRTRPLHIGTLLGNTPDMLTALAAAALGGYVLCGINNTRRGESLARDIARVDCQILITDAGNRRLLDGLDLPGVTVLDSTSAQWRELIAGAGHLTPHREVAPDDIFMMIFTSGTSGDPKAVQVAHLTVLHAGRALKDRFDVGTSDVCYLSMPLFHSNAVYAGWGVALAAGAAMVPAAFSASRFLNDVRRHGVTFMNYVGKPLAYILATPERPDDHENSLRVAFGNEASDRDIAEFARRFDCVVWDGFGSTENAVIITRGGR